MAREPFQAFISYSRGASQPLAVDLQEGIERFAKPWYRLRSMRVFRDDSSMSANTALWSTIETGLTEAHWFILLATPASAASEWVAQEIDWWLRHKGPDRLLIVQAEGELFWDRQQHCFHPASTAIPPLLRTAYREEPRWIDVRWYAADPAAGKADPRFGERVADLAAAIRGVERDTLIGENVRQHQRALRLARGGVAALAVLLVASIVAGIGALVQRGEAIAQRDLAQRQARISQARQLAATARSLMDSDIGRARLLAVQAYRLVPEVQTEAALLATVTASPHLLREFDAGSRVWGTAATADGALAWASNADGQVLEWDLATGRRTELGRLPGLPGDLRVSADGKVVAAQSSGGVAVWIDGKPAALPPLPEGPLALALAPSGERIVVVYGDQTEAYVLRRAGAGFRLAPTTIRFSSGAFELALPDDETVAAWIFPAGDGHVEHRSLSDGTLTAEGRGAAGADRLGGALSPDGRYVTALDFDNTGTMALLRTDRDAGGGAGNQPAPERIGYAAGKNDPQVAISADGRLSAYAENQVIHVAATQRPGRTPFVVRELRGLARTGVNSLAFAGQRYLLSGSDNRLLVWDLQQSTPIADTVSAPIPALPTHAVSRRMEVNEPGTRTVLVGESGGFSVLDARTGEAQTAPGTRSFLSWRDPDQFFYADASDRQVHLFDLRTQRDVLSWPLDWPARPGTTALDIWSARYLLDSDQLLISGTRQIASFQAADGTRGVVRNDLSYPTFSADGRFVFGIPDPAEPRGVVDAVSGGQRTEVDSGALDLDPSATEAAGLAHSGYQSNTLVTQSAAGLQRVLWTPDGKQRVGAAPAGIDFTSFRIAVSRTGLQYALHRNDGTIDIVDLASGTSLARIPLDHDNPKASYAYAGSGDRLLIALPAETDPRFPDGLLLTVALTPDSWVAAACRTAGRDLQAAEWRQLTGTEPPADLSCR